MVVFRLISSWKPFMQLLGIPLERPTFDRVTRSALLAALSLAALVLVFSLFGWSMDTGEKIQFFAAFCWSGLLHSFNVRQSQGGRQAAVHGAGYLFIFIVAGLVSQGA
jgi:hypothetical protein